MKYERFDGAIYLSFEKKEKVEDWLQAMATHSYETAVPRGLGVMQLEVQSEEKGLNFEKYIEKGVRGPKRLVMDYINGRDCRTAVIKRTDGKWYFNAHAFEQRNVTVEEFVQGVRGKNAGKFLDEVIEQMRRN